MPRFPTPWSKKRGKRSSRQHADRCRRRGGVLHLAVLDRCVRLVVDLDQPLRRTTRSAISTDALPTDLSAWVFRDPLGRRDRHRRRQPDLSLDADRRQQRASLGAWRLAPATIEMIGPTLGRRAQVAQRSARQFDHRQPRRTIDLPAGGAKRERGASPGRRPWHCFGTPSGLCCWPSWSQVSGMAGRAGSWPDC